MADTKGKNKVIYLGDSQVVSHRAAPDWAFLYEVSVSIDPNFWPGDRVVLPDGREYRYGKSYAACYSGQAVETTYTGLIGGNMSGSPAIGDTTLTIGAGTHDAVTENQLRGGYVVINYTAGVNYDIQVRGITGNPASEADAALTIYMDAGMTTAPTAGTLIEVYQNPWASLKKAADPSLGKLGVPAAYVSAASRYFWVQTKGPTFLAPQSTMVNNEGVGACFRADGSLEAVATALGATIPTDDTTQYAGYRLEGSYTGNGPLFYLQCA